jgi:hypothetical protein
MQRADQRTIFAIRAHKTRQNNHSCVRQNPADFPCAPHIFSAILGREPKVSVESMSKIVPINPIAEPPTADEQRFDTDCDGALSRARESRQPDRRSTLREKALAVPARDRATVPNDIR